MEKEFIPYKQALALKELGFDEEICFGRWTTYPDGEGFLDTTKHSIHQGRDDLNRQCLAPTFSQCFRWFREKYGLISRINYEDYNNYSYQCGEGFSDEISGMMDYTTYEEAELECLKKLIEIVKEK